MLIYKLMNDVTAKVIKRMAANDEGSPDGSPIYLTPATDNEFAISMMIVGMDTIIVHAVTRRNVSKHVVNINPQLRSPVM